MQTQRVAFQGEPGAYGEIAALDYFPKAKLLPAKSFQTVFEILESGKADFAVVPIENSIEGSIDDKKNNYTRFLILSRAQSKPTGHDGTSIIFSVRHTPGALYGILEEFAKRRINLTKIESRPTKEVPWEYYFYVDFEGHSLDKQIRDLIEAVRKKAVFIKILGSYKRGRSH